MVKKKIIKPVESQREKYIMWLRKNYLWVVFALLLLAHIFLRFYQLEARASFGADQVDNAWAAKKIILDGDRPLLGMVAKGNSGFYLGPAYYYYASLFYYFSNLHPIASPLLASITSIVSSFVIFYLTKKIFSLPVAVIAAFINTVSSFIIMHDRIQWQVNFIVPVSFILFYALYKIVNGSQKYLFILSTALGLSFHIHFTSIFYFIIILFSLPFFPRNKKTIQYMLLSIPFFLIWVIPLLIVNAKSHNSQGNNMLGYVQSYYHGIHLRRILQVAHDGFIEFQAVLYYKIFFYLKYFFLPIFLFVYLFRNITREKLLLSYLTILWFVVPWFAFSTYKGEISNYYFFMTRPMVLFILAYLTYRMLSAKWYFVVAAVLFWTTFSVTNMQEFFKEPANELHGREIKARDAIKKGEKIEYKQSVPEAYWYYYLKDYKKIDE